MLAEERILIVEKPKFRTRLKELFEENPDIKRNDIATRCGVYYSTVVNWEKKPMQSVDAKLLLLMDIFGKTSLDEILYVVDEDEN